MLKQSRFQFWISSWSFSLIKQPLNFCAISTNDPIFLNVYGALYKNKCWHGWDSKLFRQFLSLINIDSDENDSSVITCPFSNWSYFHAWSTPGGEKLNDGLSTILADDLVDFFSCYRTYCGHVEGRNHADKNCKKHYLVRNVHL